MAANRLHGWSQWPHLHCKGLPTLSSLSSPSGAAAAPSTKNGSLNPPPHHWLKRICHRVRWHLINSYSLVVNSTCNVSNNSRFLSDEISSSYIVRHTIFSAHSYFSTSGLRGTVCRPYTIWGNILLEGHYPLGLRCFPAATHLIHCAELGNKLFDLFNLNQVCWSRETFQTCRIVALEDWSCPSLG